MKMSEWQRELIPYLLGRKTFEEMCEEFELKPAEFRNYVKLVCKENWNRTMKRLEGDKNSERLAEAKVTTGQVKHYTEQLILRNITMVEVAQELGVEENRMYLMIKSVFGRTLKEMKKDIRDFEDEKEYKKVKCSRCGKEFTTEIAVDGVSVYTRCYLHR